jgi:hypothetical protein
MFSNLQLEPVFLRPPRDGQDFVYLLGIEPAAPNPDWSFRERFLDMLVRNFQPAPVLMHVELFVPPRGPEDKTQFATYVGRHAGWASLETDAGFYIGGRNSWRAFPVRVEEAVRVACEQEQGAPYSLLRYITSSHPFRVLAPLLAAYHKAPAHCATLSARVLKGAGVALPRTAAWYSPSTLWLELSRPSRVEEMRLFMEGMRPAAESEASLACVEKLVRGSDAAVEALSDEECLAAVQAMQLHVLAEGDEVARAAHERQLARGLLRWGEVQRKSYSFIPQTY